MLQADFTHYPLADGTNIGAVPLASVTPARLNALYRELERGGRADHKAGEGLSARTVRYVHTILSAALRDAVNSDLLPHNPATKASPPTAKQAASPEMRPWTAAQLATPATDSALSLVNGGGGGI